MTCPGRQTSRGSYQHLVREMSVTNITTTVREAIERQRKHRRMGQCARLHRQHSHQPVDVNEWRDLQQQRLHTPSIAFRHLPPNSARCSYATEGALFISYPATRSAPSERFGYYYDCRSNLAPKHARKHETHPPRVKKRVPSRFKRWWVFYLCWCKLCWRL